MEQAPGVRPPDVAHRTGVHIDSDLINLAVIKKTTFPKNAFDDILHLTRTWAEEHTSDLRSWCGGLMVERTNCAHWLNWFWGRPWEAHASMNKGLFDPEFAGPIQKALQFDDALLKDLTKQGNDREFLRSASSADRQNLERAFLVFLGIRGVYHHLLADKVGTQPIHHPIRELLFQQLEDSADLHNSTRQEHEARSAGLLGSIIVGHALLHRKAEERVKVWMDIVAKAKKARAARDFDLPEDLPLDKALGRAVDAGKNHGIIVASRDLERVFEHTMGFSLGCLAAVAVDHFFPSIPRIGELPALQIGVGELVREVTERTLNVGDKIAQRIVTRRRRLEELALGPPGPLRRRWAKDR